LWKLVEDVTYLCFIVNCALAWPFGEFWSAWGQTQVCLC